MKKILLLCLLSVASMSLHAQTIGRIEGQLGWINHPASAFGNGVEYGINYVFDGFKYIDIIGGVLAADYYLTEKSSTTSHPTYFIDQCSSTTGILGVRGKYSLTDRLQLTATASVGYGMLTRKNVNNHSTVTQIGSPVVPLKGMIGISYSLTPQTTANLYYGISYECVFSNYGNHLGLGLSFKL